MRGLREKYESAHKVRILEEAVEAAAVYSSRYISGRQLPDKAVDLLDTSAARGESRRRPSPRRSTTSSSACKAWVVNATPFSASRGWACATAAADSPRSRRRSERPTGSAPRSRARWLHEEELVGAIMEKRNRLDPSFRTPRLRPRARRAPPR
ncbi:MAG: hypothetical protein U0527_13430 [Candidatus Eisenbacteria bacterium]